MDNGTRSVFKTVIGLEVHVQLATKTKLFCGCLNRYGAAPNSQTCPVCLGMPGALPVLNKQAVEFALRLALAVNGKIHRQSRMARKHYFYPDLPKGYQITQANRPICTEGELEMDVQGRKKQIRIQRIHLEEDAGKSVHNEPYVKENGTLIDLNRCGVPLVEIVTEPDFESGEEAAVFLIALRQLVRHLRISGAHMEQGGLRCDANISVRRSGSAGLGTRTEVKNLNSIRHVRRALEFESNRQINLVRSGGSVRQETLLWDEKTQQTKVMRGKEEARDYRYFPDPDLPPLNITLSYLYEVLQTQPELPWQRRERFVAEFNLEPAMAAQLTETPELADYFEAVVRAGGQARESANWITGPLAALMKEQNCSMEDVPVPPEALAELVRLISEQRVSKSGAKTILLSMWNEKRGAEELLDELNLRQESNHRELTTLVRRILSQHAPQVTAFQRGKTQLFGFFVGQVMRASGGRANPRLVRQILTRELENA